MLSQEGKLHGSKSPPLFTTFLLRMMVAICRDLPHFAILILFHDRKWVCKMLSNTLGKTGQIRAFTERSPKLYRILFVCHGRGFRGTARPELSGKTRQIAAKVVFTTDGRKGDRCKRHDNGVILIRIRLCVLHHDRYRKFERS